MTKLNKLVAAESLNWSTTYTNGHVRTVLHCIARLFRCSLNDERRMDGWMDGWRSAAHYVRPGRISCRAVVLIFREIASWKHGMVRAGDDAAAALRIEEGMGEKGMEFNGDEFYLSSCNK